MSLRQCPHGFHHPMPDNLDYPHSCDGCWCEGLRDQAMYGWPHTTAPGAVRADLRPQTPIPTQSPARGADSAATPPRRRGRVPVPPMAVIAETLGLRFVEDEA